MSDSNYIPPQVWQRTGEKTDLNQPTSGARYEHTLPVGKHPLQLYSLATPNGQKVTILLEELLALGHQDAEYDAWLIKIGEGQQFGSGFVEINPNSKIPALVDHSQNPPLRVFESGSILLYLAEKFKAFIPTDIAATDCLSGLAPAVICPFAFAQEIASANATYAPVIAAVLVPPSACNTSQSITIVFSPNAFISTTPRRDLPTNLEISCVRPPSFPLTLSRSLLV
jgi:hypothetical protein